MYIHTYIYIYNIHVNICVYACVYAYIYIYMCLYMYILLCVISFSSHAQHGTRHDKTTHDTAMLTSTFFHHYVNTKF